MKCLIKNNFSLFLFIVLVSLSLNAQDSFSGQTINFANGNRVVLPNNSNTNFQPTFPGNPNFNAFNELTIECWVLWNGGNNFPYGIFEGRTLGWVAGNNNGTASGIHFELRPSSNGGPQAALRWGINRAGSWAEAGGFFMAQNAVSPNEWTHIAVTYNDNNTSLKIYINGILAQERIQSQGDLKNFDEYAAVGTSCCFNSNPQSRAFDGKIDEFKIWFTERTQNEIRDNMCTKANITDPNLVLYYDFDEVININQMEDKSLYNNHGALNGIGNNDFDISLAPLGNYSSFNYDYVDLINNGFYHSHLNTDSLFIEFNSAVGIEGLHIYSVSDIANDTIGLTEVGSNTHYYGYFVVKDETVSSNIDLDLRYYYGNNFAVNNSSALDPNDLTLYERLNNSASLMWSDISAPINLADQFLFSNSSSKHAQYHLNTIGDSPLPISLTYFGVEKKDQSAIISWTTASEYNNDYFILQKSRDGQQWNEIATVKGAGNSKIEKKYEVIDSQPYSGLSYYRLMQVDFDGSHEIFSPISLNFTQTSNIEVSLFPNPASGDFVHVKTNMSSYLISVLNIQGEILLKQRDLKLIDISRLSKGIYIISLNDGNDIITRKLIIK